MGSFLIVPIHCVNSILETSCLCEPNAEVLWPLNIGQHMVQVWKHQLLQELTMKQRIRLYVGNRIM